MTRMSSLGSRLRSPLGIAAVVAVVAAVAAAVVIGAKIVMPKLDTPGDVRRIHRRGRALSGQQGGAAGHRGRLDDRDYQQARPRRGRLHRTQGP